MCSLHWLCVIYKYLLYHYSPDWPSLEGGSVWEIVRICYGQGRIEHRALASGGRSPETGRGIM